MMAITSPSMSGSVDSAVWQQARRSADQAEQSARALLAKAKDAQVAADQAQERARTIKVASDQAEGRAGDARQGLLALKSMGGLQDKLQSQRAMIASRTEMVASPVNSPVINANGQQTGTLVNVTA